MEDKQRLLVVRPMHFIPGKTEQALQWMEDTEHIRRRWGLVWQMAAQSVSDKDEFVLIQLWQDREAHARWNASQDHEDLLPQRQRLMAYDSSRMYELVTKGLCETLGNERS